MNIPIPQLPKIKIIPRSKKFRPVSNPDQKYAPPIPVSYRSPTPYAHIANFGWGQKDSKNSFGNHTLNFQISNSF